MECDSVSGSRRGTTRYHVKSSETITPELEGNLCASLFPGGITSTANDMALWMNVLLSGGQNEAGEEVFSPDVIQETRVAVNAMFAPINPYRPPL